MKKLETIVTIDIKRKEEQWKKCDDWRRHVTYCSIYQSKDCPMQCNYAKNGGKEYDI
jgi:hypothetical protein